MKLNIQLFASGTINGSSTASNCDCQIKWESTSNISTNSSSVTATVQIKKSGSSSTTGTFSGKVTIDGTQYSISKKFSPYNWGSWATVGSKTVTINHNNDGTKSISISCNITNTGTSMAGTYTASGTAALDTIPRASEIDSVSPGTTPYYPTIKWTPKRSSFKYKVKYNYGNNEFTSGFISPNTTNQYSYNSLQIGNSLFSGVSYDQRTTTATLYTYKTANEDDLIDKKTKTFTVTLDSNAKPTITIDQLSEADTTMQSLNWGIYVQNKSKLSFRLTTSYSGIQAPSVQTSANTNGQPFDSTGYYQKTFTTSVLKTSGSNSITASATDIRTRSATDSKTYNVVAYSDPSITVAEAKRVNSSGVEDSEGQYLSYKFVGEIESVSNKNAKTFRIGYRERGSSASFIYKTVSTSYTISQSSWSGIVTGSDWEDKFNKDKAYEIVFQAIDSFRTSSNPVKATRYLDTGFDLLNFNPSGKAMAIGKVSEASSSEELLEIALPTIIDTFNGRQWDFTTNNTTDSWVMVSEGSSDGTGHWQHRSIPTAYNTTSPSLANVTIGSIKTKNLFNFETPPMSINQTRPALQSTGIKVVSTGTGTYNTARYKVIDITNYAGKRITLSANITVNTGQPRMAIGTCDEDGGNLNPLATTDATTSGRYSVSATMPSSITSTNQYLYIAFYVSHGTASVSGNSSTFANIQVNEGTDTTYYPYEDFHSSNFVKYKMISLGNTSGVTFNTGIPTNRSFAGILIRLNGNNVPSIEYFGRRYWADTNQANLVSTNTSLIGENTTTWELTLTSLNTSSDRCILFYFDGAV